MWYVGLDVHQRQSTYCVLDERGTKVRTQTIKGPWDKVLLALAGIKRPWAVCFEASVGYGTLYRRLMRLAQRVIVAHPGQLRLIFRSKRKNDRVDAEKLAKLLYLEAVPTVHVPAAEVQAWRGLIEYRRRVMDERVRVKNQVRALLRGQGLVAPKGLWAKAGRAWLGQQTFACAWDALRRDDLLEQYQHLTERLKRLTRELDARGRAHAGVVLLQTIPGVGPRTAEAVVAYLDDPHRFARVKQAASYFGLVPCQDASAGTNRLGRITRQGPATVRRLLVEAAWQGVRRSGRLAHRCANVSLSPLGRGPSFFSLSP